MFLKRRLISKIINEIRNNGERPRLNTPFEEMEPAEKFAYIFAAQKIKKGSTVLDFGCGSGYGSEYFSRFTKKKVIGYDIDKITIGINNEFYKNVKNLEFLVDPDKLGFYDLIAAFQVIEHIDSKILNLTLKFLKNHLNKVGILIISTVNKNLTSYKLKKPVMPYHVREFTAGELRDLLKQHFRYVKCFGQIEKNIRDKVLKEKWSYKKFYNDGLNVKVLRVISQFEIVRFFARRIPLFLKRLVFPFDKEEVSKRSYLLAKSTKEIEHSSSLIYVCKV